jgi:hypothetical protein
MASEELAHRILWHISLAPDDGNVPSCIECQVAKKKNKKCRNAIPWRNDTNKPFDTDNVCIICCFVGQKLNNGETVNGTKYDKKTGLTK